MPSCTVTTLHLKCQTLLTIRNFCYYYSCCFPQEEHQQQILNHTVQGNELLAAEHGPPTAVRSTRLLVISLTETSLRIDELIRENRGLKVTELADSVGFESGDQFYV